MMERQRAHVCCFLEPLHEPVPVIKHAFRITPLYPRQFRVNPAQFLALNALQTGVFGVAANEIEVMPVCDLLGANEFRQRKNLVKIVAGNNRVDVDDKP